MKAKAVIILLVVLCLGLAVVLLMVRKTTKDEKDKLEASRVNLSNNWAQTSAKLTDEQKTNKVLVAAVSQLSNIVKSLSNETANVSAKLTKTEADAKAAAQSAQEELAKRDAKIATLETEKEDYTKRMQELNVSITTLEKQMSDTEKKLRTSEGDRDFLLKELKRLQVEKAELERQFNNLALLRERVRQMRDELSMARRLEWMRQGLFGTSGQKGGELLKQGFKAPSAQTNFNLQVELRRDQPAKILSGATNAPPRTNAPSIK